MQRRTLITLLASLTGGAVLPTWAQAGRKDEAPDALIKRLSTDLLELVKKDPALKKATWPASPRWSIAKSSPT